jgi:hypothetical protein
MTIASNRWQVGLVGYGEVGGILAALKPKTLESNA